LLTLTTGLVFQIRFVVMLPYLLDWAVGVTSFTDYCQDSGSESYEGEGLDGKTPAEAAGIKVEVSNKWLTIIQNASHADGVSKSIAQTQGKRS
jgi:hypothetical protein